MLYMFVAMWLQINCMPGCMDHQTLQHAQTASPSPTAGFLSGYPCQAPPDLEHSKLLNMVAGAIGVIVLALTWTPKHPCINHYDHETEG